MRNASCARGIAGPLNCKSDPSHRRAVGVGFVRERRGCRRQEFLDDKAERIVGRGQDVLVRSRSCRAIRTTCVASTDCEQTDLTRRAGPPLETARAETAGRAHEYARACAGRPPRSGSRDSPTRTSSLLTSPSSMPTCPSSAVRTL